MSAHRVNCFVCGMGFMSWTMCRQHARVEHPKELEDAMAKVRQGYMELRAEIDREDKIDPPAQEPT